MMQLSDSTLFYIELVIFTWARSDRCTRVIFDSKGHSQVFACVSNFFLFKVFPFRSLETARPVAAILI